MALSPSIDLDVSGGFSKVDEGLPQTNNNTFSPTYQSMMGPGFKTAGPGIHGHRQSRREAQRLQQLRPVGDLPGRQPEPEPTAHRSVHASWRPLRVDAERRQRRRRLQQPHRHLSLPLSGVSGIRNAAPGRDVVVHDNNRNFSAKLTSTSTWQAKTWANLKTTLRRRLHERRKRRHERERERSFRPGAQTVGSAAVTSASNTLWTATKTWGYYAQEQVALRDRLFLTAAVRTDQNSAFGTNFQSVVYPKFSLSWILSDESFFPQFELARPVPPCAARTARRACSRARRRRSSPSRPRPSISRWSRSTRRARTRRDFARSALGNPNLKPERSAEFEGGFEARVFEQPRELRLHVLQQADARRADQPEHRAVGWSGVDDGAEEPRLGEERRRRSDDQRDARRYAARSAGTSCSAARTPATSS